MKLKKELGLLEVFCIASGSMISSGLFILPAVIYAKSGASIILAYLVAALFIIPAMLSKAELATAMPKSGGTYFFVNKSFGPMLGTFAGLTNWLSLALKSAFVLMGIGIFLQPLFPEGDITLYIKLVAISFTVLFTFLNIFSVKESGKFQVVFVLSMLAILAVFIIVGFTQFDIHNLTPFFKAPKGIENPTNGDFANIFFYATGMIFISYGGLTKIASIAEEIKNPGKNIPNGMMLAFVIVSTIYVLAVSVTLGVVPSEQLVGANLPLSVAGEMLIGKVGYYILAIAAATAFITTANAGIMAASRTPMAMAQDRLIPKIFEKVSIKYQTPIVSIVFTSGFMIIVIAFLKLENLVKAASAMMMLLFILNNFSIILMRESKISTYKPMYKAPFYPFLQIVGIIIYSFLLIQLGTFPIAITGVFLAVSIFWYFAYSKSRNQRQSALIHVTERITNKKLKTDELNNELKEILMERDSIVEDRFDAIIQDATIIDIKEEMNQQELFKIIATDFSAKTSLSDDEIIELLNNREKQSTTVISEGLAVPHIVVDDENIFDIIVVRSSKGIVFSEDKKPVNAIFGIVGSMNQRNFHLQTLMAIAQIIQNNNFMKNWLNVKSENDIRNLILLADRVRKKSL